MDVRRTLQTSRPCSFLLLMVSNLFPHLSSAPVHFCIFFIEPNLEKSLPTDIPLGWYFCHTVPAPPSAGASSTLLMNHGCIPGALLAGSGKMSSISCVANAVKVNIPCSGFLEALNQLSCSSDSRGESLKMLLSAADSGLFEPTRPEMA